MKKAAMFTALCGVIFAGITTTCYAAPDWRRFLPRPIVMPAESSSVSTDIMIAGIDLRKYLPRPIVIPVDSAGFTAPIELTSSHQMSEILIAKGNTVRPPIAPGPIDPKTTTRYQKEIIIAKGNTVRPPIAPGPIDPKTTTRYQKEIVISAAPVAKDPPPFPWIRKTLTA